MKDHLPEKWRAILHYNNLDSFDRLWSLETEWFEPPNQRRGAGVVSPAANWNCLRVVKKAFSSNARKIILPELFCILLAFRLLFERCKTF